MNGLNVEYAEQRGISLNTLQRYCTTALVSLRLSGNSEMTIFAKAIYLYICFLVYYVRRPTVEIRGAVFLYRPIHHRIPITSQRYELDTMERL